MNDINLIKLKEKFSLFMNSLYVEANIGLDNMNILLIKNPFFDFFEKNELDYFINASYENLYQVLFKQSFIFNYKTEVYSEIYWSMNQYLDYSFNKRVPLKQIVLLIPLKEMISFFHVYHEMHSMQMINKMDELIASRSIFKELKKIYEFNYKTLSFLTSIPVTTLKSLEDNDRLFNTSFCNTRQLKELFGISESYFYKKSSFLPYSQFLWENEIFYQYFCKEVLSFIPFKNRDYSFTYYSSIENINNININNINVNNINNHVVCINQLNDDLNKINLEKLTRQYKKVLIIGQVIQYLESINNHQRNIVLEEVVVRKILSDAIDQVIDDLMNHKNMLLF